MNIEVSYFAAFTIGLLGGVHCIGMCGGIVGALSFGLPEAQRRPSRIWPYLLAYNLARIGSYTLAGALLGGIGWLALQLMSLHQMQVWLSGFAGIFMILLGLYLGGWWRILMKVEQAGAVLLWKRLEPFGRHFLPVRSLTHAFLLGLIWGWLPCGLVYSLLIWAIASGGPLQGGLLLLSFGLGTLPNLFAMGMLAAALNRFIRHPWVRWLAGGTIIGFGVLQLSRAISGAML